MSQPTTPNLTPEQKKEILEDRETSELISKAVMKGRRYYEPMTVKGIDNKPYKLNVYVITDNEFTEISAKSGMTLDQLQKSANDPSALIQSINLQREIVSKCVKGLNSETYTKEELSQLLWPGEFAKIFVKILHISGFTNSPSTDKMDKFPKKQKPDRKPA